MLLYGLDRKAHGAGGLGMGAATIKFVSSAIGRNDRAEAVHVVRTTLGLALLGTALPRRWVRRTRRTR